MSSKQVPLWLSLVDHHEHVPRPLAASSPSATTLLFKRGDDLRQDQLTVQFLRCLNRIWVRCYNHKRTKDKGQRAHTKTNVVANEKTGRRRCL